MTKCLISYGANIAGPFGNPKETLSVVLDELERQKLEIIQNSGLYSSLAFPDPQEPKYLNGCLELDAKCSVKDLLVQLKQIEIKMGRRKSSRWSSRICDLDILSCGKMVLPSKDIFYQWCKMPIKKQMMTKPSQLLLPHPRLQDRAFVLMPLMEVAPSWIHPVFNLSVREMYDSLPIDKKESVLSI